MSLYRSLMRPILFAGSPEWVHDQSIRVGKLAERVPAIPKMFSRVCAYFDERLETTVAGLRFKNPVGLAAGYDKSGKAISLMASLGFGFIEIGSVSADPSEGNPRPRLWRLPQDRAICVHYGLPNDGAAVVSERLKGRQFPVPLGINIVKTNRGLNAPTEDAETILCDYMRSISLLQKHGDYLTLNLSCPNTEMGRDFFGEAGNLAELLRRLTELKPSCPVFLKVSPVGGVAAIERLLSAVDAFPVVSGFMFNLSSRKPETLCTPKKIWGELPGAISGAPVRNLMLNMVRELYRRMDRKRYHIIAAGGIFSSSEAYEFLQAGASLIQVFTGLIYQGPLLVKQINRGLVDLISRDGHAHVAEVVGSEVR